LKHGVGEECLKWTDRITNGEDFQRAKDESSLSKILKKQKPHMDRAYS